ncbi:MAG: STAS domain-containing protein [Chloroflexota bacterium]|nr:STAS domain-containing protein [Chloroflexota bacterium]
METTETSTIQKLENLLLVAVPRDLTDNDVLRLRRRVLEDVRYYHSRWVLLDFARVDICDSFFGRFIQSTARMAGLMGAGVVVAGLQDAVVETMVELGMTLPNIQAVLDLDEALVLSRTEQRISESAGEQDSDEPSDYPQDDQAVGESEDVDAPYSDSLFADSLFADSLFASPIEV